MRKIVCQELRLRGFETYEAWSLDSARRLIPSVKPTMMLLDLGLGDEDGYELLQEAVASHIATVVISAREKSEERVRSLTLGASDYLVKPIDLDELVLRMQRAEKLQSKSEPRMPVDSSNALSLDLMNRTVVSEQGVSKNLTPKEFSLLVLLLKSPGKTLTRNDIASDVLGNPSLVNGRSVDVLVSSLRRKLETIGGDYLIQTVRGSGYRFS